MVGDRDAISELARASKMEEPHVLLHYLYFPEEADASVVAAELRRRGFRTEERLGGDGVNWLVIARHEVVPTEASIKATRQMMETTLSAGSCASPEIGLDCLEPLQRRAEVVHDLPNPRWRRCWRALRLAATGMVAEIPGGGGAAGMAMERDAPLRASLR